MSIDAKSDATDLPPSDRNLWIIVLTHGSLTLASVHDEPARAETRERFGRDDADRLSEDALQAIAARSTGAKAAAFFDLDKTIIAKSSTALMGRTFLKDGLISPSTIVRSMYAQTMYNLVGADHDAMEKMRAAMLDLTKGWEVERVRRLVRETMEEVIVPSVFTEAMELIREHRAEGVDVWIISTAGEEIVGPFGEHLGIRDMIGTVGGIDDEGRYDGTIEFYAYAHAKANAVKQVADVRGYDLDASFAYSDSVTDLPMLNAVGNPMAVNPDKELRAAAENLGWPIRDFSKPVALRPRKVRIPEVKVTRPKPSILAAGAAVLTSALVARHFLDD